MSRPKDLELVLATVLIRCKPGDVGLEEYFDQIKASRRHKCECQNTNRHLDQSAFWKAEFIRIRDLYEADKATFQQEQNTVFTLQQQIDGLKLQNDKNVSSNKSNHSLPKRKRVGEMVPQSKKSRKNNFIARTTPESFTVDYEAFGGADPGLKALRNLHALHKMMRGQVYMVDAKDLAYHSINIAGALSAIISSFTVQPKTHITRKDTNTNTNNNLNATLTAVARSFITLLHASKCMFDMPRKDHWLGDTIYHCVKVFDSIFTTIEEAATREAKSQVISELPKKTAGQTRTAGPATTSENILLMTELTNLISALLEYLNTALPCHNDVLEGLLYHLLGRLGEIEHLITFSGPRNEDVADQIRNLAPSPSTAAADDKRLDPARQFERRAMAIEAPYMIAILKKALVAVPSMFRKTIISSHTKDPKDLPPKQYLTPHALSRLQRTLVQCIFSPGSENNEASADFLKKPELEKVDVAVPPERDLAVPKGGGSFEMAEEWFEAELWATIGWEILGTEEDL